MSKRSKTLNKIGMEKTTVPNTEGLPPLPVREVGHLEVTIKRFAGLDIYSKKKPPAGFTFCPSGCCKLFSIGHVPCHTAWKKRDEHFRAGVFVVDPTWSYVLLVQSYGRLWGPAKGVIEKGETPKQAAARELKEETGLVVQPKELKFSIPINNGSYFIHISPYQDLPIPRDQESNEITGLAWISLNCLKSDPAYFSGILNHPAKVLIARVLYINGNISSKETFSRLWKNKIEKSPQA